MVDYYVNRANNDEPWSIFNSRTRLADQAETQNGRPTERRRSSEFTLAFFLPQITSLMR